MSTKCGQTDNGYYYRRGCNRFLLKFNSPSHVGHSASFIRPSNEMYCNLLSEKKKQFFIGNSDKSASFQDLWLIILVHVHLTKYRYISPLCCTTGATWWRFSYVFSLYSIPQFSINFPTNPAFQEKKEEIWLSPMTKAPTPTEMSKGQSDNTNNATKKFD